MSTTITGTSLNVHGNITTTNNGNISAAGDVEGSSFNGGQLGGRRNLIINGAMQVSQRYGTSRTFVTANSNGYTLDRWNPGQFQQGGHQQVSVTDSSVPTTKAVRVTSSSTSEAASGTRMAFGQMVEHANCDFVAGRTVTLSCWIRFSSASITGSSSFSIQLSEYDTVDPDFGTTGANRTNPINITNGSYPTTWTKYTQTITCASTVKNIGARFIFSNLFNTTNNEDEWYEVTAVQLELGDAATPFEHRSYGEELALCQRYYYKHAENVSAYVGPGWAYSTSSAYLQVDFPVTMRVAPDAIYSNSTAAYIFYSNGSPHNVDTFSVTSGTENGMTLIKTGHSGLTAGAAGGWYAPSGLLAFESEL